MHVTIESEAAPKGTQERGQKRGQKRGWIRWRGVAALAVLAGIVIAYAALFLDVHLRAFLEDFGTRQNGARVSIASLHLSWWNHRLELNGIQVAATAQPMRNLLQLDRVTIDFVPGALLSNKLLISDLQVTGIRYNTLRETSGEIAWNNERAALGPGILDRTSPALYPALNNRYPKNPLGLLARFSMGLDVQNKFEARREHLSSLQALQQVQRQLESERNHWRDRAARHPGEEWFRDLRQRLAQTQHYTGTPPARDPAATAADALPVLHRELEQARTVLQADVTRAEETAGTLWQRLATLPQLIDADIGATRATLGLPSLDATDLTPLIFGPRLTGYFGRLGYWIDLARRRMPRGSRQGLVMSDTARGTDIHFAKMSTLPAMVIEKATFLSDLEAQPGGGKIRGGLDGITSDPPILGRPAHLWFDADFPSRRIERIHFSANIDHVGLSDRETIDFTVDSMPITHWALHNGSDLGIFIERGTARAKFHGEFRDDDADARWTAEVHGIEYLVNTPYEELADRLQPVFNHLPDIEVDGRLTRHEGKSDLHLASSLGRKLAAALPTVFRNPLGAIDDSLRKFILDELDEPRHRVEAQLAEWRATVAEEAAPRLRELDRLIALTNEAHVVGRPSARNR